MRLFRRRNPALGLLSTLLALGGASAIAYALMSAPSPPPQPTAAQAGTLPLPATRQLRTAPPQPGPPVSLPTHVRIPSIGVDAAIDTLGLNSDGTVQVPSRPDDAGWYRGSAAPGQIGAAVLLGHVDFAATGPAVFYRLGDLAPGDAVIVARADGSTARFTVVAVREFPKSDFPTGQVYGPTDGDAQLRLVTCGNWDSDQDRYVGNTVVFATLTPPRAAGAPSPQARAGDARGPH